MGEQGQIAHIPRRRGILAHAVQGALQPVAVGRLRSKGLPAHQGQPLHPLQIGVGDLPGGHVQLRPDGLLQAGGGERHRPGALPPGQGQAPHPQAEGGAGRPGQGNPQAPPALRPPEGPAQGGGGGVAVGGGEGGGLGQHPPEPPGDGGPLQGVPPVGAGEQPAQGGPQGVEIGPAVGLSEAVLLRRGGGAAAHEAGVALPLRLVLPGDAEVDEAHGPILPQHDVLRLDVPVDHGGLQGVEPLQQGAHLPSDGHALFLGAAPRLLPPLRQGLAGQEAAHQKVPLPLGKAVRRQGRRPGQGRVEPGEQAELLLQVLPLPGRHLQHKGGPVTPAAELPHAAAAVLGQEGLRLIHQPHPLGQLQAVQHGPILPAKLLRMAHSSPSSPRERSSSSVSSRLRRWLRP